MRRQGDLLIIKVGEIPQGAVRVQSRVLAEGEATGHRHELNSGEVFEKDGVLYFRVEKDQAILSHPEHHPLVFTPGEYKVVRQREYKPDGWHYVSD